MRSVHLQELDLNLLVHLRSLLEERHVTVAAKRSSLSQPAMSRVLERLREMFDDPLLVRTGRTYALTVRAEHVLRELDTLLPKVEALIQGEEFDPARSQERFRMALTDNGSAILLPPLMTLLRKTSRGISLAVSAWGPQCYADVIAGRTDTALSAEEVPRELESEVLFDLDFVCLVGSAFKPCSRRLSLKQYLQLPHVLVDTWGGQQTLVDRPLAQLGLKRTVVLSLPFFVPATFAIAHSDLVLTVPRRLAKCTAHIAGLQVVEPPHELKDFPYFMAWHPRLTNEPAHVWFREQIRQATRTV
jgi:DNA-binding transcriptional LysR family regulator